METTREQGRTQEFFRELLQDVVDTFWDYSQIPFTLGKWDGNRDIRHGKMILKTFGKPAKWRNLYAQMLQEGYGISLEAVTEGTVNAKLRERIRGYNAVMKEHMRKKHGRDFLDMVVERARDRFQKQEEERQKSLK